MIVERYGIWNPTTKSFSGDYLRVGGIDLGEFQDLVEAEFRRAKRAHPENAGFFMRSMWFTGSPYGAEIMALLREVRS